MSIPLTVNGTVFNYPTSGEDPNWAQEMSGWAEEVTNALVTVAGAGRINQTNFALDNAQTGSYTNINGFLFDQAQVKAVNATYRISRTNGSSYLIETGNILLIYNPESAAWSMSRDLVGDAQVYLDVTSGGQLQYKVIALSSQTDGYIRFLTFSTIT